MERKEQTGHICRWMALGIMTAIVIVGCTIVIGLFEWRDRKEIEKAKAAGKVAKATAGPKLTEEVKNTILPGVSAAAMAGLQKLW